MHYALEFEHYTFERHPQNNSIMPKIMLEKKHYPQLILTVSPQTLIQHFIASVTNFELATIMDRQLASLSSLTK